MTKNETAATVTKGDTKAYHLFSLVAVKITGGWKWNDNRHIDDIELNASLTGVAFSRHITKKLRDTGYLPDWTKGRTRVDYGRRLITITDNGTGRPFFAIVPAD